MKKKFSLWDITKEMKNIRRLLAFACSVFTTVQIAKATIIIIIVTPTYVMLGTDSKTTYINESGNLTEGTTAKIFQSGQYYFSATGLLEDPFTDFHLEQIVHKHLKKSRDFNIALDSIEKELYERLLFSLETTKKRDPIIFDYWFRNDPEVVSLGIIGVMDNKPTGYFLIYEMTSADPIRLNRSKDGCPSNCPEGTRLMCRGGTEVLYQYIEKELASSAVYPASLINAAIIKQVEATLLLK